MQSLTRVTDPEYRPDQMFEARAQWWSGAPLAGTDGS